MSILDIQDALALLEQGKAVEAIPLLERMIEILPRYVTPYVLLGRAYEADRQWQRALLVWQQAHFLLPNSPSVASGVLRVRGKVSGSTVPAAPPPRSQAPPVTQEEAPAEGPPLYRRETQEEEETRAEGPADTAPRVRWQELQEEEEAPAEGPADSAPRVQWQESQEEEWAPSEAAPRVRWQESQEEDEVPEEVAGNEEETLDLTTYDEAEDEMDDLDRLIGALESARIVPRPDIDAVPAPDLDDEIDDVVSETLARIYASQQQFDEAARVYELLAARQPERADEYQGKAAAMRARASDD